MEKREELKKYQRNNLLLWFTEHRLTQTNTHSFKNLQLTGITCTTQHRNTKIIIHFQTLGVTQQMQTQQTSDDHHLHPTIVPQARYLGVIVDNEFSWHGHVHRTIRQVRRIIGALWRSRQSLTVSSKKLFYHAMIMARVTTRPMQSIRL